MVSAWEATWTCRFLVGPRNLSIRHLDGYVIQTVTLVGATKCLSCMKSINQNTSSIIVGFGVKYEGLDERAKPGQVKCGNKPQVGCTWSALHLSVGIWNSEIHYLIKMTKCLYHFNFLFLECSCIILCLRPELRI